MTQKMTNGEFKFYYTTACRGMSTSASAGAGGSGIAVVATGC